MTFLGVLAESGLPLGINPLLFLAQVFDFLILWFILSKYVFPALFKTLDDRTATIREGVENAERARAELAKAHQQADSIITDAQRQSQQIIANGTVAGDRVRAQIEEEAHKRADEIAAQARVRIQQEEAQSRIALRQQVADLAINAASVVLHENMDTDKQRKQVAEFIAQQPSEVK